MVSQPLKYAGNNDNTAAVEANSVYIKYSREMWLISTWRGALLQVFGKGFRRHKTTSPDVENVSESWWKVEEMYSWSGFQEGRDFICHGDLGFLRRKGRRLYHIFYAVGHGLVCRSHFALSWKKHSRSLAYFFKHKLRSSDCRNARLWTGRMWRVEKE